MTSNIENVLKGLIPQENDNLHKSQSVKSSQVVTQRIVTTGNYNVPQFQLGSEQPSFGAISNEAGYIGSPRNIPSVGINGFNSGNQQKVTSTQSNMTTYHNSSLVSPAPTRTYQFNSSTYQSPEHNITAFNVGGYNTSSAGNTKTFTYRTVRENGTDREIDSTSQVQQELYKTSPLVENSSNVQTYEYKRIINGSEKRARNDGSVSPMNLLEGQVNGQQQKFFSTYAGGNQNQVIDNNITFKTLPASQTSYQQVTYQYQPIKPSTFTTTTQLPDVNFSNSSNGIKQSFESHSYNYKPSSVNKVTFGNGNGVNVAGRYGNGVSTSGVVAYHYANGGQDVNKQTTQTFTTVNQSVPVYHTYTTYNQSQNIPLPRQQQSSYQQSSSYHHQQQQQQHSTQLQTRTQNHKTQQIYQVVDQIERPKYQKLYGLEDNSYNGRMAVEQDPPTKKGCCGPLCWLPLLLIGAVLALFGMLCGLGVVCPGGGSLKTVGSVESVLVQPSVVLNTSTPQILKPTIIQPVIPPQTVTPTTLQPQQLPQFHPGTPTVQPVSPSYIPPISIAPSANPVAPIIPTATVVIPPTTPSLPSYNATVPAAPEPVIQIQPQVITYDRKIDEYAIDATPHVVGVVTNVDSEVINTTVANVSGVSSLIDYTTNKTVNTTTQESSNVTQPGFIQTTTTTVVSKPEANITTPSIQITAPTIPSVAQTVNTTTTNVTTTVQDGWIDPFAQQTTTTVTASNVTAVTNETRVPQVAVDNSSMFGAEFAPFVENTVTNLQTAANNLSAESTKENNTGYITTVEEVVVSNKNNNTKNDTKASANASASTATSEVISPDFIQVQPHIIPSTTEVKTNTTTASSADSLPTTSPTTSDNHIEPTMHIEPTTSVDHIEPTLHVEPIMHIEPTVHIEPDVITTTTVSNTTTSSTIPSTILNTSTAANSSSPTDVFELEAFTQPTFQQTKTTETKTNLLPTTTSTTSATILPLTAPNPQPQNFSPSIQIPQPSIDIEPFFADIEPLTV